MSDTSSDSGLTTTSPVEEVGAAELPQGVPVVQDELTIASAGAITPAPTPTPPTAPPPTPAPTPTPASTTPKRKADKSTTPGQRRLRGSVATGGDDDKNTTPGQRKLRGSASTGGDTPAPAGYSPGGEQQPGGSTGTAGAACSSTGRHQLLQRR